MQLDIHDLGFRDAISDATVAVEPDFAGVDGHKRSSLGRRAVDRQRALSALDDSEVIDMLGATGWIGESEWVHPRPERVAIGDQR